MVLEQTCSAEPELALAVMANTSNIKMIGIILYTNIHVFISNIYILISILSSAVMI
jgi:hypothetical protein